MRSIDELREALFALEDLEYKAFQSKLMPTVNPDNIIGIRTPILRKFAKEFEKDSFKDEFLAKLPHKYYEENNLHSILISNITNYENCIKSLDIFLPYIDNWATCDIISSKAIKNNKDKAYEKIKLWLESKDIYTVRFAIVTLLGEYLDEEFKEEMLYLVSDIKSQKYYINMAIAWYMSFALIKQYDTAIKIIESKKMDKFTHNKSIQKAIESYRIDKDKKTYLKSLKIK